jgi:hypothetical protein
VPQNIEGIALSTKEDSYNGIPLVKISFKFPCTWTILEIEDLKQILRLWIRGEEQRYPRPEYKGRWLLFEEILKVFLEDSSLLDLEQASGGRLG